MALAVNGLERAFTFEKGNETITLSDPNPSMTEAFIRSKRHSVRKDDGYEKENDNR